LYDAGVSGSFAGKHVVVTGGAGALGAAVTGLLSSQGHVVPADHHPNDERRLAGSTPSTNL